MDVLINHTILAMQYFTEDFSLFFKELAQNNNKEWVHTHKKRYETSVKNPFFIFVNAVISEIQQFDNSLQIGAKECVLRMHRDTRFSKDKSPYNLHHTAFISTAGKKDKSIPGIFLRFSSDMIGIMGGCVGPTKEQLHSIRTAISDDPEKFRELITEKNFVAKFGGIKGDALKRIPKEWKEAYEKEPLIAQKQYYFVTELPIDILTSDQLISVLMDYWNIMKPINDYFLKAII